MVPATGGCQLKGETPLHRGFSTSSLSASNSASGFLMILITLPGSSFHDTDHREPCYSEIRLRLNVKQKHLQPEFYRDCCVLFICLVYVALPSTATTV